MEKAKWKGTVFTFLKDNFLSIGLFFAVLLILLYGLGQTTEGSDQESLRIAEESIQRAIVSCYAVEGVYPESMQYLYDHYNLYIDPQKYYVQYQIFASNIMPEVAVIEVDP